MTHGEIYKKFLTVVPSNIGYLVNWYPSGTGAIRLRFHDVYSLRDYIFSYNSDDDWCFETIDSYIKKMKGDKMM